MGPSPQGSIEQRRVRAWVALLALVFVAFGAVACGKNATVSIGKDERGGDLSDDGDVESIGFVVAAAEKTLAARTGRFTVTEKDSIEYDFSSELSSSGRSSTPERSTIEIAGNFDGSYDLDAKRFSASGKVSMSGMFEGKDEVEAYDFESRVDDRLVYNKQTRTAGETPSYSSRYDDDGKWTSWTLDDDYVARRNVAVTGFFGGFTSGFGSSSSATPVVGPEDMLKVVKSVSGEVKDAGTAIVDGVQVHRIEASVNLLRVLEQESDDAMRKEMEEEFADDPELRSTYENFVYPVVLHIDGDGFVRSVHADVDFGPLMNLGSGSAGSIPSLDMKYQLTTDLTISGIGEPVSITFPDPSEVTDRSDRFRTIGSAIGGEDGEGDEPAGWGTPTTTVEGTQDGDDASSSTTATRPPSTRATDDERTSTTTTAPAKSGDPDRTVGSAVASIAPTTTQPG